MTSEGLIALVVYCFVVFFVRYGSLRRRGTSDSEAFKQGLIWGIAAPFVTLAAVYVVICPPIALILLGAIAMGRK